MKQGRRLRVDGKLRKRRKAPASPPVFGRVIQGFCANTFLQQGADILRNASACLRKLAKRGVHQAQAVALLQRSLEAGAQSYAGVIIESLPDDDEKADPDANNSRSSASSSSASGSSSSGGGITSSSSAYSSVCNSSGVGAGGGRGGPAVQQQQRQQQLDAAAPSDVHPALVHAAVWARKVGLAGALPLAQQLRHDGRWWPESRDSLRDAAWVAEQASEQLQRRYRIRAAGVASASKGAARQTAAAVVSGSRIILVPKAQLPFWRKSSRTNAIKLQALGLGRLQVAIAEAAAAHGCLHITVSESFSTLTCASCGHEPERGPPDRVYECKQPDCGWVCHRDVGQPEVNVVRHTMLLGLVVLQQWQRLGAGGVDERELTASERGLARLSASHLAGAARTVERAICSGMGLPAPAVQQAAAAE